jgi:nucleoside-diphosphate-sugar epimerase
MRVAVTGVAGDVGGFVARELAEHGHEVVGIDLRDASHLPLADMRQASVERTQDMSRALEGCEAVVHLAAIREPGAVPDEEVYRVNVMGTLSSLEGAVAAGATRFVLASSEATIGISFAERELAPRYLPIDEEHPLAPQDCYGLSKLAAEELCRGYAARGAVSTVCLRTCYVLSLDWRDDALDAIVDEHRGRRGLWAYVHARDAARAYRLACETPGLEHEAFFIAAEDTRALTPTAQLLATHFPDAPLVAPTAEFGSLIGIDKARRLLGFEPAHTWRDELAPDEVAAAVAIRQHDGKEPLERDPQIV